MKSNDIFNKVIEKLYKQVEYKTENTFFEFIDLTNNEIYSEIAILLEEKINAKIDFRTYFKDKESMEKLKELKEKDIKTYYEVYYYENTFLNLFARATTKLQGQIILNFEDISRSCIINIQTQDL